MRLAGKKNRSEFELDPVKALQRGRVLDAMLSAVNPPVKRGVTRGSHDALNRLDAERQSQAARKLNPS
jgi:hypothetical protein